MKTVPSILLIFSITIATGTGLVCETFKNVLGHTWIDLRNEACGPSVTSCLSSLTVAKIGGNTYTIVEKSCATNELLCHKVFNMSSGVDWYYVAKCCEGDLCNKGTIQLPPINRKENGLKCPSCYAPGKSCTPTGTMKCQGPQTKCYTFSGGVYNSVTAQFEDWGYQGCATENVCKFDIPTYPYTQVQKGYTFTCS